MVINICLLRDYCVETGVTEKGAERRRERVSQGRSRLVAVRSTWSEDETADATAVQSPGMYFIPDSAALLGEVPYLLQI
jgi:hypothetical protein